MNEDYSPEKVKTSHFKTSIATKVLESIDAGTTILCNIEIVKSVSDSGTANWTLDVSITSACASGKRTFDALVPKERVEKVAKFEDRDTCKDVDTNETALQSEEKSCELSSLIEETLRETALDKGCWTVSTYCLHESIDCIS